MINDRNTCNKNTNNYVARNDKVVPGWGAYQLVNVINGDLPREDGPLLPATDGY